MKFGWRISPLLRLGILTLLVTATPLLSMAKPQTVALTFDDLPAAGTEDPAEVESFNRAILNSLRNHRAPAIGFVNEKRVVELHAKPVLEQWAREGFDLGNHTFSHLDLNHLTLEQFEQEVVSGEASFALALARVNKVPHFLRFPYNHSGDTPAKQTAVAEFLKQRGYKIATCTIENEDYLFNEAYSRMLAGKDRGSAAKLRAAYLAYTAREIDYYAGLHEQVFGRKIPQVMLFHVNRLNADLMIQLLDIFEAKHYRFVSLDTAQSDPAYAVPDTFATSYGPMWGYRWAKELGIDVDGSRESEPPDWIAHYAATAKK